MGSYQTTLTLGGWLPIKTIRAVVTERPRVTVCGTPFGVKMFSEGALIVGFSEIGQAGGGTSNPAKEAGLRLGDRVICIGQTRTESNDAVKEALDAAEGQSVEVVYIRSGEQKLTALTPVWDGAAGQWAGRNVGAGLLRWCGYTDLRRRGARRICGTGPPHQRQ